MAAKELGGKSLTFSTPGGIEGCVGKGRTRVLIEGWAERRGFRRGRFFGVTRMVMMRPWLTSWWVRSRRGMMWPCAGNGKIRMWASVLEIVIPLWCFGVFYFLFLDEG